ncbi:MAG: hypothetical protein WA851_10360 [Xanthobacteraceae bacterium]
MSITPFLGDQAFEPEHIEAMSVAFGKTCRALDLNDRTDKLTEIVALNVIELARRGILDPVELTLATLEELKAD